jgi:excisionase family DNA binding protein
MANNKEILTIEEAAELLKLGKRSVYKLAMAKKIPAKKVLNKLRLSHKNRACQKLCYLFDI